MTKELVSSLVLAVAVVLGVTLGVKAPVVNIGVPPSTVDVKVPEVAGGPSGADFLNGIYSTKYHVLNSVSASTTTTTVASAVALRDSTFGQITLGTGTPATNLFRASTTAVSANSSVILRQTSTTQLAGVTCNTTATVTPIVAIVASSTNPGLNGFTATALATPVTNPLCFDYWVVDRVTR